MRWGTVWMLTLLAGMMTSEPASANPSTVDTSTAEEIAVAPPSAPAVPLLLLQERLAQPITVNLQAVEFNAAIDFLAESGGMTIILSEGARPGGRPVTLHAVDMPLGRAIEYLIKGQGLLSRFDGEALWIATRDEMENEPMETRVYYLNHGPGLFAAFEQIGDAREGVAEASNAIKEIKTVKDILEAVIPAVGDSSIALEERSGALIIKHAPYYLQQVETLLGELDVLPLQVLIEARFMEVTATDTKELGLDSELTGNASLTKKEGKKGTQGAGLQLASTGTLDTPPRGTKINFGDFDNQAHGLNLTVQGVLTGTQYKQVLHALLRKEKSKTLSAPRITTLNNQTATIKIVTEFVYATKFEPTVVREDLDGDGDFTGTVDGVDETRFVNAPQDFVTKDLGILFNVTPSVGRDLKTITLALKPEVSEKKTDDTFGGEVTIPRFTTRNLETTVVVENGQTIVLGGLMKDTTTDAVTRVPLLGSLPVVGPLFRKTSVSTERSNLLIFVTAQLIDPSGTQLLSQAASP